MNLFSLKKFYRDEFLFHFDVGAPDFTKLNVSVIRDIVQEQSEQRFKDLVSFTCNNWAMVKKTLKVTGYPTLEFIKGFRYSLLDLMDNPVKKGAGVEFKKSKNKEPDGFNSKKAFLNS